jgi:hypothetical protein
MKHTEHFLIDKFKEKLLSFKNLSNREKNLFFNEYCFFKGGRSFDFKYTIPLNSVNKIKTYFIPFKVDVLTEYETKRLITITYKYKNTTYSSDVFTPTTKF